MDGDMGEMELLHIVCGVLMAREDLQEVKVTRAEAQSLLKGMGLYSEIKNETITIKFAKSETVEQWETEAHAEGLTNGNDQPPAV